VAGRCRLDRHLDRAVAAAKRRLDRLQQRAAKAPARTAVVAAALEELHITLEELQVTSEELRQQTEELAQARQHAEAERQRYQELFDCAPDAYLVTDLAAVIREANRAAAALLGVPPQRLVGKPLVLFVEPESQRPFLGQLAKLAQQERLRDWEVGLQPRRGVPFQAAVTVSAVRDPAAQPIALRWLVRDITAQRRAAEALRESEQRFRAIFDQAAVGIAQLKPDGQFLLVNQRLCELLGYTPAELLTRTWRDITHADDLASGQDAMDRLLRGEGESYRREKRYRRKDGSLLWVDLTTALVRDAAGAPKYLVSVVQDITERKAAEARAREAEQAIRSAQEQLRALTSHLQQRQEEERRRLAREIHDELAQALTALKLDVAWLSRCLSAADPACRERLHDMAAMLDRLVDSVRRIGTELRPDILDDLGLAAAIEWHLQEVRKRTGMACELSLPAEEIPLDQERATAMYRIFQEALTNVLRHAEASRIAVRLAREADALVLQVADDGKGMTPDRAADHRALGLLNMQERAHLWGGAVTIASRPGQGTTVTVRLPYACPADREARR
jgi:two-component system sensor histidine kinase UhpB